jgi:Family of unknown function (DUF6401)
MTNDFLAFAPISAVPADAVDISVDAATFAAADLGALREVEVDAEPAADLDALLAELPVGLADMLAEVAEVFVPADPSVAQLDELMARVGVDGLVAAMADPGLLAQVDQHAAAVRDALIGAGRDIDAEGLASYARSIEAAAHRMGRPVPGAGEAHVSGAAWHAAEWHLMRLVAVCAIADSAGLL